MEIFLIGIRLIKYWIDRYGNFTVFFLDFWGWRIKKKTIKKEKVTEYSVQFLRWIRTPDY
jgi:hypothetical protein